MTVISFLRRAAALAAILLIPTATLRAADHLEAPAVRSDGSTDIADLFLFQAPGDATKSVMVLTVNPFAGSVSGTTFNPDASYQFQFDNDGDAVADVTYSTMFSAPVAGVQNYTVSRQDASGSVPIATGATGGALPTDNGGNVQAGTFDDPFFFDFNGFNNGFAFTGDDTFAGANVSAIVLELPSSDFLGGSSNVGAQAVTELLGIRVDRMGRPAIATALIGDGRKDDFNQGNPVDDFTNFGGEVNAAIAGLSDQANADALTPILLPDLLTYDASSADGFLNGRQLADDVLDTELGLLTAGGLTTDGVDANDVAFLSVFPYLAAPNAAAVPEPTGAATLLALGLGLLGRRSRRNG